MYLAYSSINARDKFDRKLNFLKAEENRTVQLSIHHFGGDFDPNHI